MYIFAISCTDKLRKGLVKVIGHRSKRDLICCMNKMDPGEGGGVESHSQICLEILCQKYFFGDVKQPTILYIEYCLSKSIDANLIFLIFPISIQQQSCK